MSHELRAIDWHTLQALFDLAPDVAFFVTDADGRYVTANQSLLARHGLPGRGNAIGKRPIDICPADFGRIPTAQDQRVPRAGKPLVEHLELPWYRLRDLVWRRNCFVSKRRRSDCSRGTAASVGRGVAGPQVLADGVA